MRRPGRAIVALWAVAATLAIASTWANLAAPDRAAAFSAQTEDTLSAAPQPDSAIAPVPEQPQVTAAERAAEARRSLDTPFTERLISILGLGVMVLVAWLLSVNRRNFPTRVVVWGISLQLIFALLILRTAIGEEFFSLMNTVIVRILLFAQDGSRFLFGNLVDNNIPVGIPIAGSPANTAPIQAGESALWANSGAYFAFTVLPTIIFFASLMTVLYHLRVMQIFVKGMAWVMQRTMKTSGAETLSASGNIFTGQTEAPLMIKPFVERMTMSELHCIMTGGFATVAGSVMAAYVGMLVNFFPDIAGHLLAASVMSAPAAIVISKVMYPEDGEPETAGTLEAEVESPDVNVIEAATRGASEGLYLSLNVGAMLLAFVAMIYMLNAVIGWAGGYVGYESLTLEIIFGWVLAPLAWVMGVPWKDATVIGSLLGIKTALNEFFAYIQLANSLQAGVDLSPRSIVIATYALAGFANFSSIAIQIGGIGGIAPSRKSDLAKIGLRAMIAGTLAAFMTATVAGALL